MSRPPVPGDRDRSRLDNDTSAIKTRVVPGIASDINHQQGYLTLNLNGQLSEGRTATVPMMWGSFKDQYSAAWGRYMPLPTDKLKIMYDGEDRPHVVGYDVHAAETGVADGRAGWAGIYRYGRENQTGYQFRQLQPGEYDFRSIGGAYIYGSDDGRMEISCNRVGTFFNSVSGTANTNADLHVITCKNSQVRIGEVRRPDPITQEEKPYSPVAPTRWNPDGNAREYSIDVAYATILSAGMPLYIARVSHGNVSTVLGPTFSTNGTPLRYLHEIYNPAGILPIFSEQADAVGSRFVTSASSLNDDVTMPLAARNVTYKSYSGITSMRYDQKVGETYDITVGTDYSIKSLKHTITATDWSLKAASATLTAPSIALVGQVAMGSAPSGAAMNGSKLAAAMSGNTNMAATFTAMAATYTAAGGAPASYSDLAAIATMLASYLTTEAAAMTSSLSSEVTL